jgi:UPF0042 nucleotide-binding protein
VIDNLPPALMSKVSELAQAPGSGYERVALVVGGSGTDPGEVLESLSSLQETDARVRVLFLDASTEVLVRRYESTRRRHPMADGDRLADAIERERELLDPVKAGADVVIDTSDLNVHQLKARIGDLFAGDRPDAAMQITVESFGYKHGLPLDVDLVLDCRFLPNPHWVDELRPLSGKDEAVREYVLGQPAAVSFLEHLNRLLRLLLPAYVAEGKSYLTIAFGCTGGRHRSVAIAEEVADQLRQRGEHPVVSHRDIDR